MPRQTRASKWHASWRGRLAHASPNMWWARMCTQTLTRTRKAPSAHWAGLPWKRLPLRQRARRKIQRRRPSHGSTKCLLYRNGNVSSRVVIITDILVVIGKSTSRSRLVRFITISPRLLVKRKPVNERNEKRYVCTTNFRLHELFCIATEMFCRLEKKQFPPGADKTTSSTSRGSKTHVRNSKRTIALLKSGMPTKLANRS